jgi:hypothetical protein
VLQFNYDTAQDTWVFESTATWMEDYVYTDVNDYLQYLPAWASMPSVPLTFWSGNPDDARNNKAYGDAVWNRWIEGRFGPDPVRDVWAASRSTTPRSFGPAAYNAALRPRGTSFFESFSTFAADTAEWRASNSKFEEGSTSTEWWAAAGGRSRSRPTAPAPPAASITRRTCWSTFVCPRTCRS